MITGNYAMGSEPKQPDGKTAGVDLIRATYHFYQEWSKNHKRANIIIAGKTGVGKSTLINTVFRDKMAETGLGRPVTQKIKEISKPGIPLTILDTKGLELADYESIKSDLLNEVSGRQGEDADRYIHLAWICIKEDSARIENAELDLAKALTGLGVAVMVVITKVANFKNNPFEQVVREQFAGIAAAVVLTRALEEELFDDEENLIGTRKVGGIDQLLSDSFRYIPESQRQSFANALSLKNKKAIELKTGEAKLAIGVAVAAAGAVGANPIPFSDAVLLVAIQVAMIIAISKAFGMGVTREAALPIVTSLIGAGGAALVGRAFVSTVLKFIPGIGSIAGGTIAAGTASALTLTVGNAYLDVITGLAARGEPLELQNALQHLRAKIGLA